MTNLNLNKFSLRNLAIVIFVHLIECYKEGKAIRKYRCVYIVGTMIGLLTSLDQNLLTGFVCVCFVNQKKKITNYFLEFLHGSNRYKYLLICSFLYLADLKRYCSIIVDVKYSENLFQVFLWCAIRHDVKDYHELSKIYMTILKNGDLGLYDSNYFIVKLGSRSQVCSRLGPAGPRTKDKDLDLGYTSEEN